MNLTNALLPPLTARIPFLKLEQLYEVEHHLQATITNQQASSKCPIAKQSARAFTVSTREPFKIYPLAARASRGLYMSDGFDVVNRIVHNRFLASVSPKD